MDNTLTLLNIIILLRRRGKTIGIIVLIALIFSVFSAFIITPKFKSEAVVYPTNISPYSVESQTEQMVQFMQSDYIMDVIIKEFNLAERYEINASKPGAKAAIVKEYEGNISVEKTEYESVKLKVLDKEPAIAAKIANRIIDLMNDKIREQQREKLFELYISNKSNYESEQTALDSLCSIRDTLRTKYHILDYQFQVRELYRGYLSGGSKSAEAKQLITNLEKMGEVWDDVNNEIWRVRDLVKYYKSECEKNLYDSKKKLTYTTVVVEPFANDKKAYPIRWLIVLSSTLSAFILTIAAFIIVEFNPFKNVNIKQ